MLNMKAITANPTSLVTKLLFAAFISGAALTLSACEEKGPLEKAGESMDEAAEEVKDEIDDAT